MRDGQAGLGHPRGGGGGGQAERGSRGGLDASANIALNPKRNPNSPAKNILSRKTCTTPG